MKAITIHQPWATLIALGEKRFETRSWATKYRGPLAIHAGKHIDREACKRSPIVETLYKHGIVLFDDLPTGAIVATCTLSDCLRVEHVDHDARRVLVFSEGKLFGGIKDNEYSFGWYEPGRYAWDLQNVNQIEHIPTKGKQGLWNWSEESA